MFRYMQFLVALFCVGLLTSCFSGQVKTTQERTPAAESVKSPFYGYGADGVAYVEDTRHFVDGKDQGEEAKIKELAGRTLWFKSAPTERLFSYYLPQTLNAPITWYKIMRTDRHDRRFQTWGIINDPDCCIPGSKECAQKGMPEGASLSSKDTYGWDYCRGDDRLYAALKKNSVWRDPACDDPAVVAADKLDNKQRENRCELAFGTPTGAVGFRKFPNPKFDPVKWEKAGGYPGFEKRFYTRQGLDASVEPPFRVGLACAACHVGFNPLNPPANINYPTWANLKGETGSQYVNFSAILASGAKTSSLEYQMFTHSRAGTSDTSAISYDGINNPGTMNPILNFSQRPTFVDDITRWRRVSSCSSGPNCQVVKQTDSEGRTFTQAWLKSTEREQVPHILKGGEDNVGADLAVQRVYVNIGMCAEQCWVNHFTNIRELDPAQRGYGQSEFDVNQCRQDCGAWRANEDRVFDIATYLYSRRPFDLKDSRQFSAVPPEQKQIALEKFLDQRFGKSGETGLVGKGEAVFAQTCARCHSSQYSQEGQSDLTKFTQAFGGVDFQKSTLVGNEVVRADWMGNDLATNVEEVGTYRCRALHSNHLKGHLYGQFASETYSNRPATLAIKSEQDPQLKGRGYMRNISLLSLWAFAPFMHNNALGPEICGDLSKDSLISEFQVWVTTVEGQQTAVNKNTCDPNLKINQNIVSIPGRLQVFEKSMQELLKPNSQRVKKISRADVPIQIPIGVSLNPLAFQGKMGSLVLEFPVGTAINTIGSLDLKTLASDMIVAMKYYPKNKAQLVTQLGAAKADGLFFIFDGIMKNLAQGSAKIVVSYNPTQKFLASAYTTCNVSYEDYGHEFGTQLSESDKRALTAFLATL